VVDGDTGIPGIEDQVDLAGAQDGAGLAEGSANAVPGPLVLVGGVGRGHPGEGAAADVDRELVAETAGHSLHLVADELLALGPLRAKPRQRAGDRLAEAGDAVLLEQVVGDRRPLDDPGNLAPARLLHLSHRTGE